MLYYVSSRVKKKHAGVEKNPSGFLCGILHSPKKPTREEQQVLKVRRAETAFLPPVSHQVARKTLKEGPAGERASPRASFQPQTLELELTRKGGGTVYAEVKVSFLHDQRGSVAQIRIVRHVRFGRDKVL
ncbi:MAG: hypothetical protein ABSB94_03390 [Syntrophorhabdales bacterium]|jgi:hypothetical protein